MALSHPSWPDVDATKDTSFTMPLHAATATPGSTADASHPNPGSSAGRSSFLPSYHRYHIIDDSNTDETSPNGSRSTSPSPDSEDAVAHPHPRRTAADAIADLHQRAQVHPQPRSFPEERDDSLDAESFLRKIMTHGHPSLSRASSLSRPLSPDFMPSRSASGLDIAASPPLITVVSEDKEGEDEEDEEPGALRRSVRFKSRVRISSGARPHYQPYSSHLPNPYDVGPSLSRSSSVSDSSSISAPLRPPAEDYFPPPSSWPAAEDDDETSALILHRNRARYYRSSLNAPPAYAQTPPPQRFYGAMGASVSPRGRPMTLPDGRGRNRSRSASVKSRSSSRRRVSRQRDWDWSFGLWNPSAWWVSLRSVLCCADTAPPPSTPEVPQQEQIE